MLLVYYNSRSGSDIKWKYKIHRQYRSALFIYPFMPGGLFYLNSLDLSISNLTGVWLVFIITVFYRNFRIKCKQCRPWSDAGFCGIWSGSKLFANVPFMGGLKTIWDLDLLLHNLKLSQFNVSANLFDNTDVKCGDLETLILHLNYEIIR